MRHSSGYCFRSTSSGDGAAHADGLHLSAWLCDLGVSRHAHRVARSSSPHLLLAGVHASRGPGATYLGRDSPVDASDHHSVALWPPAQSSLWERASARPLVGAGPVSHLVPASQWPPVSVWRWQSRRQTRLQEPCGAKRTYQQTSSLVFWPALSTTLQHTIREVWEVVLPLNLFWGW